MNTFVFVVLVLLVLLFFKVRLASSGSARTTRSKQGTISKSSHRKIPEKFPFGAVSIEFSGEACPAVRKLKGQRFLEMEAPILPLDGFTCSKCRCRYVRYNDRRGPEDRRDPLERGRQLLEVQGSSDRRSKRERRKVDSTINPEDYGYDELLNAVADEEV